MKVCWIGPYRDGTGYSKASIEYIMALDAVGVDVVCRPVKMTPTSGEIPDKIKELESKSVYDVDVVVQHNLPSEILYKDGVKNVAAFAYETDRLPVGAFWESNLALMDKIVVFCAEQMKALPDSLKEKAIVVPHPVDLSRFKDKPEPIDFELSPSTFKFYTVSEIGRRKNIAGLLLAYFSEFSEDDDVVLIMKLHSPSRTDASGEIKKQIEEIKKGCRKFGNHSRYPKVILITDYLSDEDIVKLHATGDVFVSASFGEAWCLPASDALASGNPVIAPNFGAFKDYVAHQFLVDGSLSPVFGVNNAPDSLYSAEERWFRVDTDKLGKKMRESYNAASIIRTKDHAEFMKSFVQDFERTKIGNTLKDVLNAS